MSKHSGIVQFWNSNMCQCKTFIADRVFFWGLPFLQLQGMIKGSVTEIVCNFGGSAGYTFFLVSCFAT